MNRTQRVLEYCRVHGMITAEQLLELEPELTLRQARQTLSNMRTRGLLVYGMAKGAYRLPDEEPAAAEGAA